MAIVREPECDSSSDDESGAEDKTARFEDPKLKYRFVEWSRLTIVAQLEVDHPIDRYTIFAAIFRTCHRGMIDNSINDWYQRCACKASRYFH
jgi:hypothetical protein